ncbi:MAG: hypothetical protein IPI43_29410 [Sandaracinaceae bacterium]|nr:hypothetical protein [Sandaracinaceae bacterium]
MASIVANERLVEAALIAQLQLQVVAGLEAPLEARGDRITANAIGRAIVEEAGRVAEHAGYGHRWGDRAVEADFLPDAPTVRHQRPCPRLLVEAHALHLPFVDKAGLRKELPIHPGANRVCQRASVAELAWTAVFEEVPTQLIANERAQHVALRAKPQLSVHRVVVPRVAQVGQTIHERSDGPREAVRQTERHLGVRPEVGFDVGSQTDVVTP